MFPCGPRRGRTGRGIGGNILSVAHPLRAISIRQPWAELILRKEKTVEFRSWRLPITYCHQWLWMHAPAIMAKEEREVARRIFGQVDFPLGGFVGRVRFGCPSWDYTPNEAKAYIDAMCCWHWPIMGSERIEFVAAKGRLRIFPVTVLPHDMN